MIEVKGIEICDKQFTLCSSKGVPSGDLLSYLMLGDMWKRLSNMEHGRYHVFHIHSNKNGGACHEIKFERTR